jgi:glycerate-2-kinase
MGTDGIDGTTEAAGALYDHRIIEKAEALGYQASELLNNNDSYSFFEQCGGLIMTGPTGTNVADICVHMRKKA